MKVVLINTPLFKTYNDSFDEDSLPPLGLGYIATSLKNNGIDVELWDTIYQKLSIDEIVAKIEKDAPDFIGLNIFTTNFELVKEIVETIQITTNLIIGGLSTKALFKKIIQWKTRNRIDIVFGDGELITIDIIKNTLKEKSFYESENRRVFKIDKFSSYFIQDISEIPLDREFFINEPIRNVKNKLEVNLVSSRGCIHNCSFCAAARSQNKEFTVREKSLSSIILELIEIKEKYPEAVSIRILDDLFLKSKASISKAIEIFSKFHFEWRSMAHIRTFNNIELDKIIKLKESGCVELFIGIESGSARIMESINKISDTKLIKENLSKIFQAGIDVKGYFIYGFPEETHSDLELTYQLATDIKNISNEYEANFRTSVFQFRPYHGTEIYNSLKAKIPNFTDEQIVENKELSSLIGRKQFNFHCNNYSNVSLNLIHDYICKTNMICHEK